jgi:hypothetical protein
MLHHVERIEDRNRRVRERRRVDDDAVGAVDTPWIQSMIWASQFDWWNEIVRPSFSARLRHISSTRLSVVEPYMCGSRVPRRLRLGPFRIRIGLLTRFSV